MGPNSTHFYMIEKNSGKGSLMLEDLRPTVVIFLVLALQSNFKTLLVSPRKRKMLPSKFIVHPIFKFG